MDQEVKVRLKRGKTDSEKKATRRERNKRYGQKTFQVPVELTKELRRIGEVEGLSSDRDVLSHLVSIFVGTKKKDQATQTIQDVFNCCHCGLPQVSKPMPPLARIQPASQHLVSCQPTKPCQQTVLLAAGIRIQSGQQQTIQRSDDIYRPPPLSGVQKPSTVKVIKVIKSKGGVQGQLSGTCSHAVTNVMPSGHLLLGTPTGSSVSSVGAATGSGKNLRTIVVDVPATKSSGFLRNVPTALNKLSTSSVLRPFKQSNTASLSNLVDPLSCGGIRISESIPVVKTEPPEDLEQLHGPAFSQTKCVDENDDDEDHVYDDGNINLDHEKELESTKEVCESVDHPATVTVKKEVFSDVEQPDAELSEEEEYLYDPTQDHGSKAGQSSGSGGLAEDEKADAEMEDEEEEVFSDVEQLDTKLSEEEEFLYDPTQDQGSKAGQSSGTGGLADAEMEDEEEDEDYNELEDEMEDEMEDEEEIDYEKQEKADPTYDPSSSRGKSSVRRSKKGKDNSDPTPDDDINFNESNDSLEFTSSSEEDKPRRVRKQAKSKKSKPTFKFPKECPVCSEEVEIKPEMIKHFETHIPVGEGSDAIKKAVKLIQSKLKKGHQYNMGWCEECKKLCMNFRGHFMLCHTATLHKLCHHCGKVVNARMEDHLISHMEVDESDYVQCSRCQLKFKHKKYLAAHMNRVHRLKRTLQCPTCGKMFKRANELSKHKVIHAATKPHPCSVCDKAFTQKSNLMIHMRQHTGDKPYVCEVCEAAFVNKVSLKNHKKKLHGIDWWKDRSVEGS